MLRSALTAALAAGLLLGTQALSQTAPAPKAKPKAAAPSPAQAIANLKIDIPYTRYQLKNGLTLVVHQDTKAPVVHFNIWYHVGSKNEPRGQSGFAHLFEHLMYQGSEHFNDDFFKATRQLGATSQNGTTSNDRTNYFQTVPKEALDSILWLESDRMGHFLGALTQARLDEQRGVVQNEKRRGDNQPYAIANDLIIRATYPEEHPYGHSVIGSMADLNAASLEQVKTWFRDYYGPSNAVIVLSGDIAPAEALTKVERYFGAFAPGVPAAHPKSWPVRRTVAQREIAYDRVSAPRLYKIWNIPQFGDREVAQLDAYADALAGDRTARLTKRLVEDEQIATSVSAFASASEIAGQFRLTVQGKPGADMARIERIVEEEMTRLSATGPTVSELEKFRAKMIAGVVRSLESISEKAGMLALGQTYLGTPDGWKRDYDVYRSAQGPQVGAAARKWLTEGAYSLIIEPFTFSAQGQDADRSKMPLPADIAEAKFPEVQRTTLSNGLKVLLVERHAAPLVNFELMVNTAYADDYAQLKPGTGGLAVSLMDDGTRTRDAQQLADQLARLGADLQVSGGGETSSVFLESLTATLDPSLAIFADVALNPAYRQADVERVKAQQIASIRAARLQPASMATRVLSTVVYGAEHPYGRQSTEASVASITRDDLAAFHRRWFQPDNAVLIVVGDTTLSAIKPRLEAALGSWKATGPTPRIAVTPPPAPTKPVVYIVDRPGSPQSYILGGLPTTARAVEQDFDISAFNTNFGGNFTSRINLNLREAKGWSYGVSSDFTAVRGPRLFRIIAEVQTDKTKESIVELQKELTGVLADRPLTEAELRTTQNNTIMGLASRWESNASVVGALETLVTYGFPDDYWSTFAQRTRSVTPPMALAAARRVVPAQNFAWVVVGDRARVEAGLRELGMEVRIVDADGRPV